MADDPEHHARNPHLQAQAHGSGQGAVGDGHGARGTAHQNRLGQRPMQRHLEARHPIVRAVHTTAPPEKLKNDRKKLEAANAIDRPKTIWISLRKPPEVSPKASARPVAMMMRSEEHTSELQSQSNLVCRLLLEKKKKIITRVQAKSAQESANHAVTWMSHRAETTD